MMFIILVVIWVQSLHNDKNSLLKINGTDNKEDLALETLITVLFIVCVFVNTKNYAYCLIYSEEFTFNETKILFLKIN
jgi:hypothetical protein